MPEQEYEESFGWFTPPERKLVGAGDTLLKGISQANIDLRLGRKQIEECVYVVRSTKKLLLGVPVICKLGLIHDIPSTFSMRAVEYEPSKKEQPPLDTKDRVFQCYPSLFTGLGKMKNEYTICPKEGAKPFCLTMPARLWLPLQKKVKEEIMRMVNLCYRGCRRANQLVHPNHSSSKAKWQRNDMCRSYKAKQGSLPRSVPDAKGRGDTWEHSKGCSLL